MAGRKSNWSHISEWPEIGYGPIALDLRVLIPWILSIFINGVIYIAIVITVAEILSKVFKVPFRSVPRYLRAHNPFFGVSKSGKAVWRVKR